MSLVEFAILGPLEATLSGTPIPLGAGRQRALLAFLLIHANQVVSSERLIDGLWGQDPPAGAAHSLHVYVSRLRKALEPQRDQTTPAEVLVTRTPGYMVRVGLDALDRFRFERFVADGRRMLSEGDPAAAAKRLDEALALWRGPALVEFADEAFAQAEAARLEELRMGAFEDRVEAKLALGHHSELIGDMGAAARANPLRERLWALWMLALYRSGRQSEALRIYQELRTHLGQELGITPSPELVALEEAIVLQKPELDWVATTPPATGHPLENDTRAPARRQITTPETCYAKSGDVDIAYQVSGVDSPDLLMFSTAVLPIDSMDEEPSLARFNDRLASFSRLMRFDVRGVGMSDSFAPSSPPTLEQWIQDAVAVLDAAGSERVAVLGPRDASLQALLLATTYPDRVSSLIIANGTARLARADDYPIGAPQRILDRFLEVNMEPDAVERGFDLLAVAAPTVADDNTFRAWWNRAGNRGASPARARAMQAVYQRADLRPVLPLVAVPTLILHCRDNAMIRASHGRYLAANIPGAKYVELPGADDLYWVGDADGMLDEIEEFLTGVRPGPRSDRILATVLFTDIVGSTRRAAEMGERRWRDLLDRHDLAVRRQLERFRGQEIKMTGDGVLATFDGPARAVRCGCAIRDAAAQLGLEIRAGVHTGEVEVRGDDIGGMAVHIAARVESLAEPSEVLVSRTVVDLIVGSGIETIDRGEHALDGVPGTWRVFTAEG
jgi:DNA-binding SARP family transcriptional activator/class 3 adenylate cyclase/pimeloyl-ACP methyl ester carboxylesterase